MYSSLPLTSDRRSARLVAMKFPAAVLSPSRHWWTLAVLVLIVGGVAWAALRKPVNPEDRFRTVTVDKGAIVQLVVATGTLKATAQVNVGSQLSGTIAKINADFNQAVKAGEVLAEIDSAQFRSSLKQAQANLASAVANLELARSNEERNRSLVQQQFIARQQLDATTQQREAAQAQVDVARAQVERAQTDLANTVIRSPVSGVVVDRQVDVGQTVAASFQTPNMFVIARDLSQMEIHASVSEADVGGMRERLPAEFRVDAFFDRKFSGAVRQIRLNPKSEQGVVTYNVVITADNRDRVLLPGMTARVDIVAARKDGVLKIANAALRFRPDEDDEKKKGGKGEEKIVGLAVNDPAADRAPRVHRLRDGKPERVDVKTGISDGRFTELLSGALNEGDKLVIRDVQARQAGDVNISF